MATEVFTGSTAQQKDNLCGPFWAARVLTDAGFETWEGEQLDEDLVALRAGTLLPEPDDGSLPPGAQSLTGYRFELPRIEPGASGTEAGRLAEAIERASAGALRCVPIRGSWNAHRVSDLVEGARGARLIANVRTGAFWGSRPTVDALLAELRGETVDGPPADWDVGHFCELELVARGPGGALVVVHDSYPSLGRDGRHLQPPRAVAAALCRGDGREGGVLAVARPDECPDLEALARDLALEIGIWDNGTKA